VPKPKFKLDASVYSVQKRLDLMPKKLLRLPCLRGAHLLPMTLVLASSLFFIWGVVKVYDDSNTVQQVAIEDFATTAEYITSSNKGLNKGQISQVHDMLKTDLQCGTYLKLITTKYNTAAVRVVKCLRPQPGVPFVNDQSVDRLPLLVGVGPAKTGSTYLFSSLDNHPNIVVGNSAVANKDCCGSELYFFTSHFDYHDPISNLSMYFISGTKRNVKWLAEKTPVYHHDLLAPYRMKATIQPSNLALVFTLREPVEAHVSLFFHRMYEKSMFEDWSANRTGYLAWTDQLLDIYDYYQNCARRTRKAMSPGIGDDNGADGNDDLSWVGVQYMDEALHYKCLQPSGIYEPFNLEGITSLLYAQTLLRWRRTFPTVRATCILHSDIVKDGEKQVERVLSMLGLKKAVHIDEDMVAMGISVDSLAQSLKNSNASVELVGEARLLAAEQGENPGATVEAVKQRLNRIRDIFR
jgi:hypothetical protein